MLINRLRWAKSGGGLHRWVKSSISTGYTRINCIRRTDRGITVSLQEMLEYRSEIVLDLDEKDIKRIAQYCNRYYKPTSKG